MVVDAGDAGRPRATLLAVDHGWFVVRLPGGARLRCARTTIGLDVEKSSPRSSDADPSRLEFSP